jgi:hypothetical protein
VVQVDQCGPRNSWISDLHANAGDRIQHPRSYDCNYTRSHLNVDDVAVRPTFTVLPPDATPLKRVPLVMDNDFTPDMGRMTPRLLLAGIIRIFELCAVHHVGIQ